jgi:hypothetical protein
VAVGAEYNSSVTQTLAEDTNGRKWSAVLSPSPGTVSNFLSAASCANATRCMAVGGAGDTPSLNQNSGPHRLTLVGRSAHECQGRSR